jgi:hypothetical protein
MSKSISKILNRRALMAACLITPAAALSMGTASAAPSAQTFSEGQRAGSVVATAEDGSQIFEVLDAQGQRVGYTIESTKLEELNASAAELEYGAATSDQQAQAQASGVTGVAACVAAIAWFAAQTVFPTVRVANLAIRLGGLVSKYGARTVARIFMGARVKAGRTAQQEIKDFALAASGIGGLMACGI